MTPRRVLSDWRFWLVTLAALGGAAVTAALGRWQLDRAGQKLALEAAVQARAALPALETPAFLGQARSAGALDAGLLHRKVHIRGHWQEQHTVYLDNRQMQGRQGFFVLTPLQIEGSTVSVLVQRGWIARNFQDRTALEPLQTQRGLVEINGRVAAPPGRLLELDGTDKAPGSSRIRQNLDLSAFREETGLELADLSVLQTDGSSDGLQRQWPAFSSGVDKHHGYAFQWFGLSGLIVLLYVWFQLVRRFRPPRNSAA